jgi:uncharacterized protein YuzE
VRPHPLIPLSLARRGVHPEGLTLKGNERGRGKRNNCYMKKKISIAYDQEADVVYLSFGEPVPAVAEEIQEGVFARYDPQTEELVGLTVTNFSKKFGVEPKELSVPVRK